MILRAALALPPPSDIHDIGFPRSTQAGSLRRLYEIYSNTRSDRYFR
jgi:hypothetical protein